MQEGGETFLDVVVELSLWTGVGGTLKKNKQGSCQYRNSTHRDGRTGTVGILCFHTWHGSPALYQHCWRCWHICLNKLCLEAPQVQKHRIKEP